MPLPKDARLIEMVFNYALANHLDFMEAFEDEIDAGDTMALADRLDALRRPCKTAPQLLAALSRLTDEVGDGLNCDPSAETIAGARHVIRKAGGTYRIG